MRLNAGFGPFFPACCVICGRIPAPDLDMCPSCLGHLTSRIQFDGRNISILCPGCGADHPGGCAICDDKLSQYARIICPYRYTFPLNRMIQALKYGHDRVMGRVLGELLAYGLRQEESREARGRYAVSSSEGAVTSPGISPDISSGTSPDIVIPVPLHANRLAQRGFNHAADIARFAARRLNLPWSDELAERIEDTGSLAGLSRAEREHRIRGAFAISDRVADQHIVIVDDVLTTGATSGELARELYDTGAATVELWVVARTPID